MKNDVKRELLNYKPHEQLVLLCSRFALSDEEKEYIKELVVKLDLNWYEFLGMVFINRVNGVVYRNIKDFEGIPIYALFFLKVAYEAQKEKMVVHQKEIAEISERFEAEGVNYSFLKGSVLNQIYYNFGERISNDTDLLVDVAELDKVIKILVDLGYIQGDIENNIIRPATKKEILFARLNTYEIVSLIKETGDENMPFHIVDINFRLGNDDGCESALEMLKDSLLYENNGKKIRSLSLEKFLIFLCIHHYREATMIMKIANGNDFTLYKWMDIHFFVKQNSEKIDWNKLFEITKKIRREKDVYYTFFYAEKLYPGTFELETLKRFEPRDVRFLEEYKGRDNTDEIYKWEITFEKRAFSYKRRLEAMKNIAAENDRFKEITKILGHE